MWKTTAAGLNRIFIFNDFNKAFSFMTKVAVVAEEQHHHPDWRNIWNRVEITLCTHDKENAVTDRDHKLAAAIDEIYERFLQ